MPLDFPNSPAANATYSDAGKTWVYNGTSWTLITYTGALGDGVVNTAQIANTAVTSAKIANTAITGTHIANTSITHAHLAANAAVTNLGFTPADAATAATTGKAIAMSIVFGG